MRQSEDDKDKRPVVVPTGEKRPLPRRFYKAVAVERRESGFAITLDGKAARTPGKTSLIAGVRPLADAIAAEWAAQEGVIDPRTMPITRLMNSAIDHVGARLPEVKADIVKFAGSDLVCYRADGPEGLVRRQRAAWDPVLAWASRRLGQRFAVTVGVMPVEQRPQTLAAVGRAIETYGAMETAALHVMTTIFSSVLLTLAHAERILTAEQAWSAAHIDEDWQIEQWGNDADAAARRAHRQCEFEAASYVFSQCSQPIV